MRRPRRAAVVTTAGRIREWKNGGFKHFSLFIIDGIILPIDYIFQDG